MWQVFGEQKEPSEIQNVKLSLLWNGGMSLYLVTLTLPLVITQQTATI